MDTPLTDITKILQVIILVIIAPLMPIVIAQAKRWVDSNVAANDQRRIEAAITVAVLAAEQLGLNGKEAKNRAIMLASSELARYGLEVDFEYLETLIEAEVMDQFNRFRPAVVAGD